MFFLFCFLFISLCVRKPSFIIDLLFALEKLYIIYSILYKECGNIQNISCVRSFVCSVLFFFLSSSLYHKLAHEEKYSGIYRTAQSKKRKKEKEKEEEGKICNVAVDALVQIDTNGRNCANLQSRSFHHSILSIVDELWVSVQEQIRKTSAGA